MTAQHVLDAKQKLREQIEMTCPASFGCPDCYRDLLALSKELLSVLDANVVYVLGEPRPAFGPRV
jgi:hypothetical protein